MSNDLISRSAVISLIDKLGYVICRNREDFEANRRVDKIKQCVIELPTAYDVGKKVDNNGWIPIWERLPENNDYILVSFDNFSVPGIGRYEEDDEGGVFCPGDEDKSYSSVGLMVNAWMPLPEVYKSQEKS